MSEYVITEKSELTAIADAIRAKNGTYETYSITEIPLAISEIKTDAAFNIAHGDTAPEDTSKLWIQTTELGSIEVKSKIVPNHFELETDISSLATPTTYITAASVGTKIYLFGGYGGSGTGARLSTIYMFDTETETLSRLNVNFPKKAYGMAVATVGTKIYFFGGYGGSSTGDYLSTIYVFDTETDTISTLSATLPHVAEGVAAAAVGSKIYLFGGNYDIYYLSTISVFDTVTNTISTLSDVKLPVKSCSMSAATIGTKIYLFGGSQSGSRLATINVFDTKSNTIYTLPDVELPAAAQRMASVVFDTKVYLFGGSDLSNRFATINVFDAETNTISTLPDVELPTMYDGIGAAAVGSNAYLFGGTTGGVDYLSSIHKWAGFLQLAENNIVIEASSTKNLFNILPSVELGVSNVYLGNNKGLAEKVLAYLYHDGEWTDIVN